MSSDWGWANQASPYHWSGTPDWVRRLQQAEQSVVRLTERLDAAERQLKELQSRTPIHVEYHFDQLKVNELKGTLNVGLSPQGVQGIDSFESPVGAWQVDSQAAGGGGAALVPQLQQSMDTFMDREAPAVLAELEQKNGLSLDAGHRSRLLADIKKQIKERVHYYATMTPYPANGTDQDLLAWQRSVTDRTSKDVKIALATYLDQWKIKHMAGDDRN